MLCFVWSRSTFPMRANRPGGPGGEDAHGREVPAVGRFLSRASTRGPRSTDTSTKDFFKEKQGAGIFKHGLFRRYVPVFVSKVGSTAQGGRVYCLDAYAGAGMYDDGTPGSPLLVATTASEMARLRDLRGIYVEEDRKTCDRLKAALQATGTDPLVYQGRVERHLDSILAEVGRSPLFAFFDPFGLGLPFDILTQRVLGRATGFLSAPTEVLLNLSLPGLWRNAGHLAEPTSSHQPYLKARKTILIRMDAAMGGDWWRPIWTSGVDDKVQQIVQGYWNRLKEAAGGWGSWLVPVSERWGAPPIYCLIFLSKHPDGMWAFTESLSLAKEEYYEFCHRGQLELETKEERWAKWTEKIARNIDQILAAGEPFTVRRRMEEVYGETMGDARERHIRGAIKKLYAEGKTTTSGKGEVPSMRVFPAPDQSSGSLAG